MCFHIHTNSGFGRFSWRQVLAVYQTILSFYLQVGYQDEDIAAEYYKQGHFIFTDASIQKFYVYI
jgi:hypothetical protein